MSEDDKKGENEIRASRSTWKIWLGLILFITYVVGIHIENNSPSADANRQKIYQNSVHNSYQEAYDTCSSSDTDNEKDCREEAEHAAELTREHLGSALGQ